MELMTASNQWANRPDDERFWTIKDLMEAATNKKNRSIEGSVLVRDLKFNPVGDEGLVVVGSKGIPANISNYAFEQFARKLDYPVNGLVDKLNGPLAAQVLNYRMSQLIKDDPDLEVQALFENAGENDNITIRSVNSERYARIFDCDVIPFAMKLQEMGWRVPPARPNPNYKGATRKATKDDILSFGNGGLQVKEGDDLAPAGIYMGDRDMFVFMADDKNIKDDGGGHPLMRGLFLRNSEVGFANFSITEFLTQGICGNHICWGVKDVVNVRYRHVGEAFERVQEALRTYLIEAKPRNLDIELQTIDWMRKNQLGDNRNDVVDTVYKMRLPHLTKKILEGAYANSEAYRQQDGDPNTWYGFANAITRYSQSASYADKRHAIDSDAGKLFSYAAKEAGLALAD